MEKEAPNLLFDIVALIVSEKLVALTFFLSEGASCSTSTLMKKTFVEYTFLRVFRNFYSFLTRPTLYGCFCILNILLCGNFLRVVAPAKYSNREMINFILSSNLNKYKS